jgi:hypothetical protein
MISLSLSVGHHAFSNNIVTRAGAIKKTARDKGGFQYGALALDQPLRTS